MAKDKISDYSATANSNTDIGGVNIDEGCAPSGINDAIRTLMKQLKDFQQGTNSDSFNGPVVSSTVTTPIVKSATTLKLQTNGTTDAVTIDTSQNVGIGTSSPNAYGAGYTSQTINNTTGAVFDLNIAGTRTATFYALSDGTVRVGSQSSTPLQLITGGTERARIDSSGNVGIGTSSPQSTFQVGSINSGTSESTNKGLVQIQSAPSTVDGAGGLEFKTSSSGSGYGWKIGGLNAAGDPFVIGNRANSATFTERARIDSSGNLLVGTTSQTGRLGLFGPVSDFISTMYNTASSGPRGINIYYGGAAPNSTASPFLYCNDTSALRAEIRSNGGIANYSANNVNLSDERTKTDIQDAGGYLAKICAIPVRTFKYKDQTDDLLNLGVIAQEVEAVAPELVDMSGFGETPEDGVPLKAIYQTDLQYALMKCIQEQQALITSLTERLTALENK